MNDSEFMIHSIDRPRILDPQVVERQMAQFLVDLLSGGADRHMSFMKKSIEKSRLSKDYLLGRIEALKEAIQALHEQEAARHIVKAILAQTEKDHEHD